MANVTHGTEPSEEDALCRDRAEAYRLFTKDWNESGSCSEAFWRALDRFRAAGVREATAVVRAMPPGVPNMGADDHDDWTLEDVAREIERRCLGASP